MTLAMIQETGVLLPAEEGGDLAEGEAGRGRPRAGQGGVEEGVAEPPGVRSATVSACPRLQQWPAAAGEDLLRGGARRGGEAGGLL